MPAPALTFVDRTYVLHRNRRLIYFGGTDYHRMSSHPEVTDAMCAAAQDYGISCTGSRVTTGNHPLHESLETKLAAFFHTEAALVFASGYLAAMVLLPAIVDEFELLLLDETAHPCLSDAARMLNKPVVTYAHNDPADLRKQLRRHLLAGKMPLIVTDGVFAARGDLPPLAEYAAIAEASGGKILLDDCHAMGVLGDSGLGSWEMAGIKREMIYQTGTLSKAFGVFGGVITGSKELIRRVEEKSMVFIGSTGLPLPLAAAGVASLEWLTRHREVIGMLQQRALATKQRLREAGLNLESTPVPIIAFGMADPESAGRMSQALLDAGIYPSLINYPGTPPGGLFRFALSSAHTDEQLALLVEVIDFAFS
ncbi:MAG: pyridoxal phosphate-dependent aminotransferase family protein [Calditrichaeota bacterium]|nr:pyridoxal phosphate-dependent aminotransferase family protein [Calditrichota bacterium]MCB0303776.1 pyridoxal phosphate-dependent aminotransferase family protein [Calditrichota bacterium]